MNNFIIRESSRGYDVVSVESELLSERRIFFTEEVNDEVCKQLIQQILYFNSQSSDEIVMYINSPGGKIDCGLPVYDAMRMSKAPIRTVCIGTAASMGSILFLAGDKREMLPHARVMIHDPSFGGGSYAGKKPHEIQSEVDRLNEFREKLCRIIAERTGRTLEEIYEKTKVDSYFDAEEAIKFGLATAIADNL